nr:hypothetical protein B0A51_02708 [Rachicladosporium sp. CCFEE 5018]
MLLSLASAAFAGLLITSTTALPLAKRDFTGPVITTDFPDPSIIKVGDTWYAFGTQSVYDYTNVKIQLATSTDFVNWSLQAGYDALGNLPSWAEAGQVWAPDVFKRADGSFIMYFSATTTTAGNGAYHCFGTATSNNIAGPYYSNTDTPFACPTDQGGAIDASAFQDVDGSLYVLYKIDANSMGHGGVCGNTVDPIVSTPIMIQKVEADGTTKIGDPTEILSNGQYDGPLVEAPSMARSGDGTYILYFSSNCYRYAYSSFTSQSGPTDTPRSTDSYDTSYATGHSPTGPFTKAQYPLLVTGTNGVYGPGGADIDVDSSHMAFHAYVTKGDVGGRRAMYTARVRFSGGMVSF